MLPLPPGNTSSTGCQQIVVIQGYIMIDRTLLHTNRQDLPTMRNPTDLTTAEDIMLLPF